VCPAPLISVRRLMISPCCLSVYPTFLISVRRLM
jgi:hypothetical protein